MTPRFTSSKTCAWNSPRASTGSDADRMRHYGPLHPMHPPEPPVWRGKALLVAAVAVIAAMVWGMG